MSNMQILFLTGLFFTVSGLVFCLIWLVQRPRIANSRLNEAVGNSPAGAAGQNWLTKVSNMAAPLARLALPKAGWESSGLNIRFMNAGLRHASASILYFAAKAGLAMLFPVLFMSAAGFSNLTWGSNAILFTILLLACVGYYLPNFLLSWRIRVRQRELFEAFPDATDLIIVCIEAGLGLDAAIARTGEEMQIRSPTLAEELHLVGLELRVGASRTQALRNLALRTGLDEVAALVTMLLQADRFGTSIAESLRVHADSLRTRRRQNAEEAAAKIPLKLLFPLIFFIFPTLMLVLLGPAVISIYRMFLKNMVGQ